MPRPHRNALFVLLAVLLPCAMPDPSLAAWPSDPLVNVPLCTATNIQDSPRSCSDGEGGAIVIWTDDRSGNDDVYAQRVSRDGAPEWTANGVALCTLTSTQRNPVLCADGAGGAVITWQDNRNGNYDIYVQRINSHGAPQWTANGVALCTAAESQTSPAICADGSGGAVVAWPDYRSGVDNDVYVRRVNSSGTPQWTANGVALCTATGSQSDVQIVPDGAGGAAIAWVDFRNGFTNSDIYVRRVTNAGVVQWTANGIALCDAVLSQSDPAMVSDGAGGAIVTWTDYRNSNSDIYAQRVTSSGLLNWTVNGVAVCAAADDQEYPDIVSDGTGGFFVAWSDLRNGADYNTYTQKMDADGNLFWTANGVSLCSAAGDQGPPHIAPDGTGGAIVEWSDQRAGGAFIYARRVSAGGALQWTSNGVALCTVGTLGGGSCIVPDAAGGAIVAWSNVRGGGSSPDIYAQRVDRFGAIGEAEPAITAVEDVAGDQGGKIVVEWTASYLDVEPTFGIENYSVWRQVPSSLIAQALAQAAAPAGAVAESGRRALRTKTSGTLTEYWEYVGSTPARARDGYSFVVPTTTDSTAGSNPTTPVMVSAEASSYNYYWDSAAGAGYSVDNLAPPMPSPFTGEYAAGTATLQWGVSPAPDFAAFRLYRGGSADFIPSEATLIATTTACNYVDAYGGPARYRLCAVDVHGNASPSAMVVPNGAVDVPGAALPRELALSAPAPNPLRGSTTLRLALPRAAQVSLDVYDQQGRRVRRLLSGAQPAGEQMVAWDGRDEGGHPVPSGMYFVRCKVEGREFTRRIAALR